MITKAALSDECQTVSADQCNVCSARFSPLPFLHSSGNHWTASCDYVSNLIPPAYFYPAMEEVFDEKVDEVLKWANTGKGLHGDQEEREETVDTQEPMEEPTSWILQGPEEGEVETTSVSSVRILKRPQIYSSETFMGRGRFAMEHWIHSHPYQKPCDVYPGKWAWAHDDLPPLPGNEWVPELRSAPRGTLEDFVIPPFSDAAKDQWFCGKESRLFEFAKLYKGKAPPLDSWFWSFYEASKDFCRK